MSKPSVHLFNAAVRYLLYPVLALITILYLVHELQGPASSLGHHHGLFLAGLIAAMVMIEATHALRADWRMTRNTFWRRDLPFLLIGAATLGLANFFVTHFLIRHAVVSGQALKNLPLVPGVVLCILLTDLLWYWVHRLSHEARGRHGSFLWSIHVAHHLPRQVYVMMHAVAHPLNTLLVRAILTVPSYLLGFSPEVVFVAAVVTNFQGLVSHFNVDSRVGWLNYVLIGTELHRHHHSADAADAKNFGAVVSVWDQLFGTFVYRPAQAPLAIGVDTPARYPGDTQVLSVLLYPWRTYLRGRQPGLIR